MIAVPLPGAEVVPREVPDPVAGEVVVAVGVFADGVVPGHEFAGTVHALGPGAGSRCG